NRISGPASGGNQYVNNISTNTPFLGGNIRVVGVSGLATFQRRGDGPLNAMFNGSPLAAVFALSGVSSPGGATFTATGGWVGGFTVAAGTFDPFKPETWGATNATGMTAISPVAVWDLKPPE